MTLGDGLFPNTADGVMPWISKRQHFESLGCQHARQAGSAVGRQIHDLFAAGAAVKKDESPPRVGFFFRRVKSAVHVPVIAVALIASPSIGGGQLQWRCKALRLPAIHPRSASTATRSILDRQEIFRWRFMDMQFPLFKLWLRSDRDNIWRFPLWSQTKRRENPWRNGYILQKRR